MNSKPQPPASSVRQTSSKVLRSKAGYPFDYSRDIWRLDGSSRLHFSKLAKKVGSESKLFNGMKYTLGRLAVETSAGYTTNCLSYSMYFLNSSHFTGDPISALQLRNYRASLTPENEYKLGYFRAHLRTHSDFGQKGLTKDVMPFLDSIVLRGNKKGEAVKTRCPHSGPYTTSEQSALLQWATTEFVKKSISLKEYAWFYCSFVTGRRSVNLRALRAKDLKATIEDGVRIFRLAVPRGKQRGASYRSQFREVLIGEDLYQTLSALVTTVHKKAKKNVQGTVPDDVLLEMPIFVDRRRISRKRSPTQLARIIRDTPDYLHIRKQAAFQCVQGLSHKCIAISERTGDSIHITQSRMRRTRATNLKRKGIGGTVLAYMVDHSDTQNVGVYTENTPNVAERIDEAMLPALAPLAMAAEGMLIDSERDAIRANDPHSRIHKNGGSAMGNCGNEGFCAGGIKSCLICVQFQPWMDAPWNELLAELLNERDEHQKANVGNGVLQSYDLQITRAFAIKTAVENLRTENG